MASQHRARGAARKRRQSARRVAMGSTAVLVALGAAVGLYLALRPSDESATRAAEAAAGTGSSATPEAAPAADAVGFHPSPASDAGIVETLPADVMLPPPSRTLLPVGAEAPDFALRTPRGETVKLSDYRGKTVLLEFFATWCPHCQAEAPHLARLMASLPASGYIAISVNADSEDAASLWAFDRYYDISWPTLLDPGPVAGSFRQAGGPGPVTMRYGVALFPTFYIVDAKGEIVWRNDREQPDALLAQRLRNAAGP
jgi:peroxiredoxin